MFAIILRAGEGCVCKFESMGQAPPWEEGSPWEEGCVCKIKSTVARLRSRAVEMQNVMQNVKVEIPPRFVVIDPDLRTIRGRLGDDWGTIGGASSSGRGL